MTSSSIEHVGVSLSNGSMGDLPNTWFLVHPTIVVHQSSQDPSESIHLDCVSRSADRHGDERWARLSSTVLGVHLSRRWYLQGPSNSHGVHFETTYKSRPIWIWNNTITHIGDNIEAVSLFYVSFLCYFYIGLDWILLLLLFLSHRGLCIVSYSYILGYSSQTETYVWLVCG